MSRPPALSMVLLTLAMVGCGARSELRVPVPADAVATDAESRDAADRIEPRDSATDSSVPDAPPPCPELTLAAGPVVALTSASDNFATPRVVSRLGGFDVFAPDGDMGIHGRRLTISGSPAAIVLGDPLTLGDNSWTWAETGAEGTSLALCYSASGPTFRVWEGAYGGHSDTSLSFPSNVGTCAGAVWAGDRWISGWSNYSLTSSWVVEHDRSGTVRGPARTAGVDLSTTAPSLVAYGNGAAWAGLDAAGSSIVVVFAPRGRADARQRLPALPAAHSFRLAAWPPDPSAVAVTWREASTAVHLLVMREDGSISVDRTVIVGMGGTPRAVEIAPFLDGVVIADIACGDFNPMAGRIGVHRFGADGSERGMGAVVALDCGSLSLASIAASDQDIALVWLSPRPGPLGNLDVTAAAFRCGR